MGDWPQGQEFNRQVICSASLESIGPDVVGTGQGMTGLQAWPTANLAIFVPFLVFTPFLAKIIGVDNGATVSGNIDVGIYDGQQNRLVSTGSTAHAGTSTVQTFDITDTLLLPGIYYMAQAMDNTTGITHGPASTVPIGGACGVLQMASAFPLPDPATFAAHAVAFIPILSVYGRTVA